MTPPIIVVAIETLWLLTIYGKRFFDWWDDVSARADSDPVTEI